VSAQDNERRDEAGAQAERALVGKICLHEIVSAFD
jgi:hypothetical protein